MRTVIAPKPEGSADAVWITGDVKVPLAEFEHWYAQTWNAYLDSLHGNAEHGIEVAA